MSDRQPSAIVVATIVLVAAVLLYPVSFGPAVWLTARGHVQKSTVESVYWPMIWAAGHGPSPLRRAALWWGSIGVPAAEEVVFVYGHGKENPDGSMGLKCLIFRGDAVAF